MKAHLKLIYILFALLCTACGSIHEDELNVALGELDEAIELRSELVALHEERIAFKRTSLGNRNLSYQQRLEIMGELIDEYNKYQLDSTIHWTRRAIDLATQHSDTPTAEKLKIQMLQLYSAAGFYAEAEVTLRSIDTLTMSPRDIRNYYLAAHTYYRELREYSADLHIKERSAQMEQQLINRLIDTETDTLERHKLLCIKYSNISDWEGMSRELEYILPTLSPESQEFAYYSYIKALSVGDDRGTPELFMTHLARSARADMRSCTCDHASLCMLSESLFYKGDIKRAFRYIQIALKDASFYNSRLRPWQVASLMPVIEKSYNDRTESQHRILTWSVIIISLLLIVIFFVLMMQRRKNRQIKQAKVQLEKMNSQLSEYITRLSEQNAKEHELSAELTEANTVKEQYIGLFLVICSNYIDLLKSYHNNVRKKLSQGAIDSLRKEVDSSKIVHEAEEEFYANFDNAFLNLYPTFVEELNALLKEEAQITLKNPRTLNTELRIFALIKLGITDSSRIASLLRYSVNTIYNYRSMVKNNAKISRNNFEDNIKRIGAFKK